FDLERTLDELERRYILGALERSSGVQVRAAELLGIKERSLWHRIKKLGIRITRGASEPD
ncbi:MAG TPA: helix-turn-helix domain-containing protein, partial [Tahibacter sp.]|nr:helix-turn-helix domain-containing protein [Tahibacter sp.]